MKSFATVLFFALFCIGQAQVTSYTYVDFPVCYFAFAAQSESVYAIVPDDSPRLAAHIVRVNSETGLAEDSLFLDHAPYQIRISENELYAYVSFSDYGAIKRINLNTWMVDQEITLGTGTTMYALNFITVNGSDTKLAVALSKNFNHFEYLAIYEDGVELDSTVNSRALQLASNPDGTMLFGFNSENSGARTYQIKVDNNGAHLLGMYEDVLRSLDNAIKAFGNLVLSSSGGLVDAFTTPPTLKGIFYVASHGAYENSFTIDPFYGHARFINPFASPNNNFPVVQTFDTTNFARLDPSVNLDLSDSYAPFQNRAWETVAIAPNRYAIMFGGFWELGHMLFVSLKPILAVKESVPMEKLQLYPNPATDVCYINAGLGSEIQTGFIYDMKGQLVETVTINGEKSFPISHLSSGLYRLVLGHEGMTFIKK